MASSQHPNSLTQLQKELLAAFFDREKGFFLTGGGALAGFYFGHRTTDDLDFFSAPGPSLDDAQHALEDAAASCGATTKTVRSFQEFRRLVASRGDGQCIVDLVIDRAPVIDPEKARFGTLRVDTLREIAANKVCTLIGRSEIKDLVDFERLMRSGINLEQALADAQRKDAGADPGTLAWVLDQIVIGPEARLPGRVDPERLTAFRDELVKELRALALRDVPRR